MSDDDLIRRGDAMAAVTQTAIRWSVTGEPAILVSTKAAISALPAVVPGVKALEWEPSVIGKPWHSAKSPWGFYYAQWDDETQAWFASLEMGEVEAPIILSPSDVPSLEAAKAAAQADYEARILAALAPTDAADAVEAHDEQLGVWADELMADLVLNGLMDLVNHDYDTKVGARREIIAALEKANQARAPQIAPTDAAQAREAAARLLLDMLHMRNGAHEGVSKEDAQAMWEAASTRQGYAAVDAFLRSIIGETRT